MYLILEMVGLDIIFERVVHVDLVCDVIGVLWPGVEIWRVFVHLEFEGGVHVLFGDVPQFESTVYRSVCVGR